MNELSETDFLLITSLKKGDEKAFEKIYSLYSGMLYGKILKLTKSPYAAEEILQVTFTKLWAARDKFDPDKPIKPYLFAIANNATCDFFRQAKKDSRNREDIVLRSMLYYDCPAEANYADEKEQKLKQAIESLPKQRQLIFTLCKLNGKSYAEVSKLLQVSTSTINDHIVKAVKFLKEQFNDSLITILVILLNFFF